MCDVAPRLADLNGDGDGSDAGEFGDGSIDNSDVLLLFRAALLAGERPRAGSDRSSAMDAAADDAPPACGGDGRIVNSDVVLCFRRSLLDSIPSYTRRYGPSGCRSERIDLTVP